MLDMSFGMMDGVVKGLRNYELMARFYRNGMNYCELRRLTGLSEGDVYKKKLMRLIKNDLRKERRNIAWLLESLILEKAGWDEAFVCAYVYIGSCGTRMSFEKIYLRCRDLFDGMSNSECAERWRISEPGVCLFRNRVVRYNNFNERIYKDLMAGF